MKTQADFDALRRQTDLSNWRTPPYNRWAYHNVRQIVPTAPIYAAGPAVALPRRPRALSDIACSDRNGVTRTFNDVLDRSYTDALLVMHQGEIVAEHYFGTMQARDPHITMSVSKSMTAAAAGICIDKGLLDPDAVVETYIPELAGSGFAGATLQQVLDMRVGLAFVEDYYVSDGVMIEYREATGWNPPSRNALPGGLHDFLLRLKQGREHGGSFQYTSPCSDLLGWLLETVTGKPLATLFGELVWGPIGAEFDGYITVDRHGGTRAAGGFNLALRDLGRMGLAMQQMGTIDGRQVLPSWWVADTTTGGDRKAWADGNFEYLLPGGCYRNKWYQYGNDLGAYCCIGIHGQFLYVAPAASVVIAHFASHPDPFDADAETMLLDAFDAVARAIGD